MTEKKERSKRFKYYLSKGYPYAVASYAAKLKHTLGEALEVKWGFKVVGVEGFSNCLYYRESDFTYLTTHEDDTFELYTAKSDFKTYAEVWQDWASAN